MVFARAAYSHSASLTQLQSAGAIAGRPADHTAPFLLPSCAGLNGATARVLSEPHTSGFAARPKPPPEAGRTVCTKRRSLDWAERRARPFHQSARGEPVLRN
jgi:hypothetical protein